jgi:hypothetical protein
MFDDADAGAGGHGRYYHKWNFAPKFKMKLPIPLSPAKTAMEDAKGPISNVPYCVVRICNLGKLMDSSSLLAV